MSTHTPPNPNRASALTLRIIAIGVLVVAAVLLFGEIMEYSWGQGTAGYLLMLFGLLLAVISRRVSNYRRPTTLADIAAGRAQAQQDADTTKDA